MTEDTSTGRVVDNAADPRRTGTHPGGPATPPRGQTTRWWTRRTERRPGPGEWRQTALGADVLGIAAAVTGAPAAAPCTTRLVTAVAASCCMRARPSAPGCTSGSARPRWKWRCAPPAPGHPQRRAETLRTGTARSTARRCAWSRLRGGERARPPLRGRCTTSCASPAGGSYRARRTAPCARRRAPPPARTKRLRLGGDNGRCATHLLVKTPCPGTGQAGPRRGFTSKAALGPPPSAMLGARCPHRCARARPRAAAAAGMARAVVLLTALLRVPDASSDPWTEDVLDAARRAGLRVVRCVEDWPGRLHQPRRPGSRRPAPARGRRGRAARRRAASSPSTTATAPGDGGSVRGRAARRGRGRRAGRALTLLSNSRARDVLAPQSLADVWRRCATGGASIARGRGPVTGRWPGQEGRAVRDCIVAVGEARGLSRGGACRRRYVLALGDASTRAVDAGAAVFLALSSGRGAPAIGVVDGPRPAPPGPGGDGTR